MVYQTLHGMIKIEMDKIERLENSGSYMRHIKFSGYKGSMSKDEGVFDFLEITLFSESKKGLEIIIK